MKSKAYNTECKITYRKATAADLDVIHGFIKKLAISEKRLDEFTIKKTTLRQRMFSSRPYLHCMLAQTEKRVVGFAIYLFNVNAYTGIKHLYIENLYVNSDMRGYGIGKTMLAKLGRKALAMKCDRIQWTVERKNTKAIEFYKSLGAKYETNWLEFTLSQAGISKL